MSESPHMDVKLSPAISPHHPSSPPSNTSLSNSNAQLATLLAETYKENEQLKRESSSLRRRAEKAEKLVQTFQKIAEGFQQSSQHSSQSQSQSQHSQSQTNGSPNGHPLAHIHESLPPDVVRIILDSEERASRAESALQEAESKRLVLLDSWHQLDKFFSVLEVRQSEARAGFDRTLREGTPLQLQMNSSSSSSQPMGPPSSSSSKRRAPQAVGGFPSSMSLPPIPGTAGAPRIVRARTPSMDSQYPPAKRARGNSDEMMRGVRGAYSESHIDYPHHRNPTHRMIHPPDPSAPPSHHQQHQQHQSQSQSKYPRSRSRSSSQSSLDEMIIQASTPFNGGAQRRDIPVHGAHVGTYQTHVFAPVVTGAPQKKTKFSGPPQPAPVAVVNNEASQVPYPATNEQGQRICRQCGLPGRYKEGKCVEKWGPGPMGPGTVCDRCRKKMKRVERRGTLESQQLQAQQLQAAHTLGVPIAQAQQQPSQQQPPPPPPSHSHSHHPQPQQQHRSHQPLQRTETQLIPPSSSASSAHPSYRDDRDRYNKPRPLPSPGPSIAALREDEDEGERHGELPTSDVGRGALAAASRSNSRTRPPPPPSSSRSTPRPNGHSALSAKRSPLGGGRSPMGRSPMHNNTSNNSMDVDETDADADADAEAEEIVADDDGEDERVDDERDGGVEEDGEGEEEDGDADADAELLEAVNAAEANSSSSGRKSEGI